MAQPSSPLSDASAISLPHVSRGWRKAWRRHWRASLAAAVALGSVAFAAWWTIDRVLLDRQPIKVGILHSLTGPMAISETSMVDAEVLALEEINRDGGLLGRPVEWVIADGASDWPTFARKAQELIHDQKVDVIFGCWTSASRKTVLPVVEAADHLLVYPMAYEGLEQSPNVIYVGAAPNQQIIPAVQWASSALSAKRFMLVGSDYIWPRCVNAIAGDQIRGLGAQLVGESYVPFGSDQVDPLVQEIVQKRPDVVLSSVVGDSAVAFFRRLRQAGIRSEDVPVISFSIAEDELQTMPRGDMVGDYAAWNYFQSLDSPTNQAFVRAFKARYGSQRTTAAVAESSYTSVRLWAQAVLEAGTADVVQVRSSLRSQSMLAPEGVVSIDRQTNHAWLPVRIGRIQADGQFEIVWDSQRAVRPVPFPLTRSRADWEQFVRDLYQSWGRRWSRPVSAASQPALTGRPGE
ncbi:MAG: urea ABC transporter substrate-binding protein [Pirellulales bacterium]|jgi:urea transport system substrate-binding protein